MSDEVWLEIEEATKDFDFEQIKSKFGDMEEGKTLEPIKNIRGLVKSYIDTQKMVGDPDSRLPKDDAGWEKFYRKRGKPETPDGYEFNLNEYKLPEDIIDPITKNLYDANLTNEQANKVVKTFLDLTAEDSKKTQAEIEAQKEQLAKDKQVRYGDKLPEVENLAKSYLGKIENEKVKASLEALMETPDGLEFLSGLGSKFSSDDPSGPSNRQPPRGAKTAKEQIEALKADRKFLDKLFGRDMSATTQERKNAQDLWRTLHEEAVLEN